MLVAVRQKAVSSRGGNGFLTVAAAHAALLMARGACRLLRSMPDQGVLAVLDPRVATARYSGFIRASLPPFRTIHDPGGGPCRPQAPGRGPDPVIRSTNSSR